MSITRYSIILLFLLSLTAGHGWAQSEDAADSTDNAAAEETSETTSETAVEEEEDEEPDC